MKYEYVVLYYNGRDTPNSEDVVIVSIPAIREEKTIGNVIKKVREQLGDNAFIVVCVGDRDDPTVGVAIQSGADAVILQQVRGYGLAHLSAMHYGKSKMPNAKTIMMVDADDTYDLSRLREMVELSRKHKALVIGNRLAKKPRKEAMSTVNYIGNKILSQLVFRIFFGEHIPDTQSGLKIFPADLLPYLHTRGMEFSTEVIVASLKSNIPIYNVPIDYNPRQGSPSKLRRFRDSLKISWFMFKEGMARFTLNGILSLLIAQIILVILLGIGLEKILSLILSGEVSIWFGFILNDKYYSRVKCEGLCMKFVLRGVKYNLIYASSVLLASFTALLLHNFLKLHLVLANLLASLLVFPLNYVINLHLTWKW